MPEGTSSAHMDQSGSLGMDEQVFECPCCRWDSGHILQNADQDAETPNQNKKKSRRHQRFIKRRALEKIKDLQLKASKKALLMTDPHAMDRVPGSLHWDPSQNDQPFPDRCGVKATVKDSALSSTTLDTDGRPSSSRGSGNAKDSGSLPFPMLRKLRKCVAIDCEMVGTGPGGRTSELARCTVVNYDGDVIYDKYVSPELPVVDYRTRWSGITQQHMKKAIPFRVAQREVLQILKDKIVVGHAIHNDFRALKYFHPKAWVRDTSQCPPLRTKAGLPLKASVSLKSLASHLLRKNIQISKNGHSSVEDAQTSMELYRLVEVEWEQSVDSSSSVNPPDGALDSSTDSDCYMDDQFWPKDLDVDCK